jgi:hypothetical protein
LRASSRSIMMGTNTDLIRLYSMDTFVLEN